jgi:hypothetical protein
MSEKQIVKLVLDRRAPDPPDHAVRDLAGVLGDGASISGPDEAGVVEVELEASDLETAIKRVWDAVAAAGADDHLEIAEHPEIPGHWRPSRDS